MEIKCGIWLFFDVALGCFSIWHLAAKISKEYSSTLFDIDVAIWLLFLCNQDDCQIAFNIRYQSRTLPFHYTQKQ